MTRKAETFAEKYEELILATQLIGGAVAIGGIVFMASFFLGGSESSSARDAVKARLSTIENQEVDLREKVEPTYEATPSQ